MERRYIPHRFDITDDGSIVWGGEGTGDERDNLAQQGGVGVAGNVEANRPPPVSVVAVHYSGAQQPYLDSAFYGTGKAGVEQTRDRAKRRYQQTI